MKKLSRFLLPLVAFFFIHPDADSQSIQVSGEITENTEWSADTIKVTGDITIQDSVTLIIRPGTRIEFQGHYKINVYGTILAEGLPGNTIIFTIYDTLGFENPDTTDGGWNGIKYDNSYEGANGAMYDNDTSRFSYCIFEYGKPKGSGIENCGGAFYVNKFSKLVVEDCKIQNNIALDGSAFCIMSSSMIIRNNAITECSSVNTISIDWGTDLIIEGNYIANNYGRGIRINAGSPVIINNLICNNTFDLNAPGTALFLDKCNSLFINNTICNNKSWWGGGGMYCQYSAPHFYNTIFWGNEAESGLGHQVYLHTTGIQPNFYHCIIDSGTIGFGGQPFAGKDENNMESDPHFVSPAVITGFIPGEYTADWSLSPISPAINAGIVEGISNYLQETDQQKERRIRYGIPDIGAIEFRQDYINVSDDIDADTTFFSDTIRIDTTLFLTDSSTWFITPGTVISFSGMYQINVKGTMLAIGTPEEKIIFTASDTSYFENPDSARGGWLGLVFHSTPLSNDTSKFSNCIFEYGKKKWYGYDEKYGGAIHVESYPKLIIENCLFRKNYAIRGGAIFCNYANIIIRNNTFIHNKACYNEKYGGALCLGESSVLLENNLIINNEAGRGGGIYIEAEIFYPTLINNIICNNYGGGGGGIYCKAAARIINNTICNNQKSGIYLDECNPEIINSVLWNNWQRYEETEQIRTNGLANPRITFCNIQGGLGYIYQGIGEGVYLNNIDENPGFVRKSEGVGIEYDGLDADWSPDDFSACIDKGNSGYTDIPSVDFSGNPRINNDKIDIGAIENQGRMLIVHKQPQNQLKCETKEVVFDILVSDTAKYQWQKNGIDIPGADLPILVIDSVLLSDQGNYTCLASNAYGIAESNAASLIVTELPVFLQEPKTLWTEKDKTALLKTYAKGSNLSYQWQKNEVNITGAVTPEIQIAPADYVHEGRYRCIISNSCGADTTQNAYLYIAPQLCMVTVSTLTGNNLIIWEKQSIAPLTVFNIYRESTAAGIYDLIGTLPYNNLSIFEDSTADPTKRAYIYKITGIDTSGTETDINLCKPHKTIHLLVSTNPELKSTQLAWDKYYGFDYLTYTIYRSSTGANFTSVDEMPSSLNSWTDPEPVSGELYYRVAVEKPSPCIPLGSGKKAESGPYSHSMSNIDDNRLQAGEYPPDTIFLTNQSIDENNLVGKLIGKFLTTDPDTNDAFTYTLISGDGDDDNLSFTLLSDLLLAADYFDYEIKNQYSIRVRSTDKTGNTIEGIFIININDMTEPTGVNFPAYQQIVVYPNPMQNIATLVFPNPGGRKYTLIITNLAGKVARRIEDITTSSFRIDRGDLENGYYLIELKGDRVFRGKIVIE